MSSNGTTATKLRTLLIRRAVFVIGLFASLAPIASSQAAASEPFDRQTAIRANDMGKKSERDMLAKHRMAVTWPSHGVGERLRKSVHDQITLRKVLRMQSVDSWNALFIRHLIEGGMRNIEAQRVKGRVEGDYRILV